VRNKIATIQLSDAFVTAVLSQGRVSESPHNIYRYPARFSPTFAREAIRCFTDPGDLVVDPFCGGGTSIVEAISLGRRAAGMDINSLATFLTRAKTTPLSVHDVRHIRAWAVRARSSGSQVGTTSLDELTERSQRYIPWHISAFFKRVLSQITRLPKARQQNFVRLVLLSVGQWGLDCKTEFPTVAEIEDEFLRRIVSVTEQFRAFLEEAAESNQIYGCQLTRMRRIVERSCAGCETDSRIPITWLPAKLVLTSPPYPGVHVLYHRWQIQGRRETSAPFWLANQRDGAFESHYTFGPRNEFRLPTYFSNLRSTFSSIRTLINKDSLVVQLVGFSKPVQQLPMYLRTMTEAGFREVLPDCSKSNLFHGRIWRNVPSRRWYASMRIRANSCQEVLLLHKIA
jgi:DNA methylase